MKVIYTKNFPPGRFQGINLCGFVFVKKPVAQTLDALLRHEHIHTLQQREMLFVPFFLWYVVEYLFRLVQYRGNTLEAYLNISFEREAYAQQSNLSYPRRRRFWAWLSYLRVAKSGKSL